jgi:hypothetical protein
MGLRPATMYENNLTDVTHLFSVWLSAIFTAAKNPFFLLSTRWEMLRCAQHDRLFLSHLLRRGFPEAVCVILTASRRADRGV